ncbi:hypothetical protein NKDENANG_00716 [Candidatus Entotheonellaceae bacterium PAL068K]
MDCAVSFLLVATYALTTPPSVALEDDGLFIMTGYLNGIAHPPGYLLHTALNYVFTQSTSRQRRVSCPLLSSVNVPYVFQTLYPYRATEDDVFLIRGETTALLGVSIALAIRGCFAINVQADRWLSGLRLELETSYSRRPCRRISRLGDDRITSRSKQG